MAKEDLNNAQAVTEPDLNKTDVVNQEDLNNAGSVDQQTQDDTLADGTKQDKAIPYAKLKEATEGRKKAEEDALFAQRQLEILQSQGQQPQQVQQQAGSTFEQALLDLGLTADDYFGDNIVKVQNRKAQIDQALLQQQTAFSANQQFMASHPDFAQVVGSVNLATGQIAWSQEAIQLQQKKPWLAGAFQTAQGAYQAIMDERKFAEATTKATVNQEHQNRQNADTVSQPLGGSAAGGGGAGDTQNQPMMSREAQLEVRRKIAAGEKV